MSPVSLTRHQRISVVTIDNPPVNALSQAVRSGLMDCFDEAEANTATTAIVLLCAGRTFVAGADIREFDLPPLAPHLPDVIARIETCAKPVLAAMHGTVLGGGLELAMACHYRLADSRATLGLPEVKLGLLPGATGTQRLPRLVGVERALDMMLSGDPVDAGAALQAGLVDAVTENDLLPEAVAFAAVLAGRPPRRVRDLPVEAAEDAVFAAARQRIAKKARGLVSPEKIVRAVELATELDFDAASAAERRFFKECKDSPQSQGLRHAFFAERASSRVPGIGKETPVRDVSSVAVIGAGTMGAGIAYACLAAGFGVRSLDKDEAGLGRGIATVEKLFEGGVARGKIDRKEMQASMERFRAVSDFAELKEVDLVIEAVFENMAIKKDVFARLD